MPLDVIIKHTAVEVFTYVVSRDPFKIHFALPFHIKKIS